MRFRSSYSCGAAEDFPSSPQPSHFKFSIADFGLRQFWIQSKIQNQKSKTGGGLVQGVGHLFPLHPAAVNKFSLTGLLSLSSIAIGKAKIYGNTDPAFHNFLTMPGWDETPSLDRFARGTVQ